MKKKTYYQNIKIVGTFNLLFLLISLRNSFLRIITIRCKIFAVIKSIRNSTIAEHFYNSQIFV